MKNNMYLSEDNWDIEAYDYLLPDANPTNLYDKATTPTPTPTPFFPPMLTLREEEIQVDIISPENGYFITTRANKEDPYTDLTTPTVFIDNRVMQETKYLMDQKAATRDEVALFYLLKKVNSHYPHFLAYGYFITEQEVTGVEVEADGEDIRRYYSWLQENLPTEFKEDLHRKLLPTHSHHTMGNQWSGTDLKQQNSRGDMGFCDDYRMYAVYTLKEGLRMSYVQYFPIYHRIENINIGLKISTLNFMLSKERKDELNNILKCLVLPKQAIYAHAHAHAQAHTLHHLQAQANAQAHAHVQAQQQQQQRPLAAQYQHQSPNVDLVTKKYKLLGFLEVAYKVITTFNREIDSVTNTPHLNIASISILTDLISKKLQDYFKGISFTTREEFELKLHLIEVIEYVLEEYSESLPITNIEVITPKQIKSFSPILDTMTTNLITWIEDPTESIPKLKSQLNQYSTGENLNIIEEVLYDGLPLSLSMKG